jgi:hypothetical protein
MSIRPIRGVPAVREVARFTSDFDRRSFGTLRGKYREILGSWNPPGGFSAEIPKPFRRCSDRFPVIRNRELITTSREIPAREPLSMLEATEPSQPAH